MVGNLNIDNIIENGKYLQYVFVNRKCIWTKSGRTFNDMNSRCLVGGHVQKKTPAYIGCETSIEFKDFQFFAKWHEIQIGFGLLGYELDKDILKPRNKIYCPELCVMVPKALNTFLVDSRAIRGELPQGVVWHKQREKYQAQIKIHNKNTYLGLFTTIEAAYNRYKEEKYKLRDKWVKRLENKEFIVDPRVIEAIRVWTISED